MKGITSKKLLMNSCLCVLWSVVGESNFSFLSIPAGVSQNVTYKSCFVCLKSVKYALESPTDPWGPWGTHGSL